MNTTQKDTGKATLAIVLACCCWIPLFNILTSTLGLIYGILAIRDYKKDKKHHGGIKRAVVAVIVCIISLILTDLYLLLVKDSIVFS